MTRIFLLLASVSGFLSVALGAFTAHALKDRLDAYHLDVFRKGVEYQFYHTFALALVGLVGERLGAWARISGWLFVAGILVFSGSLYTLALTRVSTWGTVTPIGGLCFLAGWAILAIAVYQS